MILVAIGGTGWPVKFYQGFQEFFFCICFHFISIFRWFLLLQSRGTAGWPVKVSEMPPLAPGAGRKANEDEDKGAQPQLFNIANILRDKVADSKSNPTILLLLIKMVACSRLLPGVADSRLLQGVADSRMLLSRLMCRFHL